MPSAMRYLARRMLSWIQDSSFYVLKLQGQLYILEFKKKKDLEGLILQRKCWTTEHFFPSER